MTRVLIVDDNAENLYLLRALLQGNGCETEEARNGVEALAKARRQPPGLVIADLLMPVMDGYTLLRHWKADERLKQIPFIVYTATYTQAQDEKLALDLGADAFILKPSEPAPFLARLREVLARSQDGRLAPAQRPLDNDHTLLLEYNQVLIHKLEDKTRELEQSNRDLAVREARFRAIFEQAAVGVARIAPDGHWLDVNERLCGTVGYSREELLTRTFQDITYPDDLARSTELARQLLAGEISTYSLEKRYLRKERSIVWVNLTVSLVRELSGEPRCFIAVVEDVTARHQLELQYRQSQKMEAIGQLAGGVAHDFNNILAAMMMQAELTASAPNLPEEAREGLKEIRVAAEHAANLVRQLLLFSRRQVMQPRDLDLNEAVTSLARMLQRVIGEDVRLHLHLHPAPLMTRADEGMLDQVLMNLAVNARDAMPEGGRLLIETAAQTVDQDLARLQPDAAPGRYVCLSVSDTGAGIPTEVLPRIFEPFFTTKEPGKGTGLGLATVFGIVKQHRGWLKVYSEPGQGANFKIFLPASEVTPEALARLAAQPKPRGGTETLLLVEDDRAVRMLTRAILERNGYQVLEAAQGAEALQIWQEHQRSVALLLTDLVMPGGLTGQQLARQLQADRPEVKVIFLSGYSEHIAGQEIALRRGENFVQKPFSPELLLHTLRRCLDS